MKRRSLLAGTAVAAVCVAGCLSDDGEPGYDDGRGDSGEDDGDGSGVDAVAYEQCENRIVRVSRLPEPAEQEALAALEDDGYETDGEPVLAEVIDVDEAYLEHDEVYYEVDIETDGDTTRVHLTTALPTFREDVVLENVTDDELTVDVRVEHEETDDVLLEETFTLAAGGSVTLTDEIEFSFGTYHATLDGDDLAEDGTWEIEWELDQRFESGYAYPLQLDEHGVFEDPVDRDSSDGPCTWNEEGEVSTGH